jgi:hypothetical protein
MKRLRKTLDLCEFESQKPVGAKEAAEKVGF